VDDNADALLVLQMLLELKGYSVVSCTSGKQALKVVAQQPPQAVLLDLNMPEMDGYETCRLMQQQYRGQIWPIIALTGFGQPIDRQRTRESGFDCHLVKPVDVNELTNLLFGLLDGKT